jgi:hypothetical protein
MRPWLLALAMVLVVSSVAQAYGPSIHMREGDRYIELCETAGLPGPEHDPILLNEQRRFVLLGSIFPDIARVLEDSLVASGKIDETVVDPHNRHFNYFLLQDALDNFYPNEPWKVAFAAGCLIHNTGDLVAQGMLTQHMAVRGWTGEMDVFPGSFDDHPGGEIEALVEGGLEFKQPAFEYYLGMAAIFLISSQGRAELSAAVDYYMTAYAGYFGLSVASKRSAVAKVRYILADIANRIPYHGSSPAMYEFARSGFTRIPASAALIDAAELQRVLQGPAGTQEFWDIYFDEGYYDLSPTIMLGFEPGQGYFDLFPNWNGRMMQSGANLSLNHYLPKTLAPEDGRFLWNLTWKNDDTGQGVTSISATAPPSSVTVELTFYDVPGRTQRSDYVTLAVRSDDKAGAMVVWESAEVGVDPWTYDVNDMTSFSVTFDPGPAVAAGTKGFFVELYHGTAPVVARYFTTDWSVYEQITEIDMTKAAYTNNYSTYDDWPYSLKVVQPAAAKFRQ